MIDQLCNVAYVAQVEHMDKKEFSAFERDLHREPGKVANAAGRSTGVNELMAVMRQGARQR